MSKKSPDPTVYASYDIELNQQEKQLAQRLMISIRYFCEQPPLTKHCVNPVTQLPKEIAHLISTTDVGGVVLFAENIESHEQVIRLTNDLQQAASQSSANSGLFIGIDQEGGRVVRLQRSDSTAFSGNMAIGATYPNKGDFYASQVGRIIGKELNALGINLNFAPDVDVNNNPDNPVINVRSFGEDPKVVSKLGIAMLQALQDENVIATLKHFPGHGNTSVDSHTGLPLVAYDKETIYQTDLVPFQQAIKRSEPGMVMTAHIQYPQLDDSELITINGESIIVPATMSKKILTDLLKEELSFKGVVITDALNMAGISHHFNLEQATAESLLAGADIALMPFKIRTPADTYRFKHFVRAVTRLVSQSANYADNMNDSLTRIALLKSNFGLTNIQLDPNTSLDVVKKVELAHQLIASDQHRAMQKQLAIDSITLLKSVPLAFPLTEKLGNKIHFLVQDSQQQQVVDNAVQYYWPKANQQAVKVSYTLLADYQMDQIKAPIVDSDSLVIFYSEGRESAVVKGEIDDLQYLSVNREQIEKDRLLAIQQTTALANQYHKPVFFIAMQSPYDVRLFMSQSSAVLAAYDGSIYQDKKNQMMVGYTYDAIIAALFGINIPLGQLPVSLNSTGSNDSSLSQTNPISSSSSQTGILQSGNAELE